MRQPLLIIPLLLLGCAAPPRSEAPHMYYGHLYTAAREVVRHDAHDRRSTSIVLDNMRLGLASLAWGDLDEAESALLRAYEYLTSGGVNDANRTLAATFISEGHRVWLGEPYEQAMSFYHIAVLYLLKDDPENARAAIRNALFSLREFKGADEPQQFQIIQSQFTLGYLILGLTQMLTGNASDAAEPLRFARELNPALESLTQRIADNDYDTLLLIDYGRGPNKVAYGPNDERIRFVPDGRDIPPPGVRVAVGDQPVALATDQPVVDLWVLSQFPRWWSLETSRRTRSDVGGFLTKAGLGTLIIGGAGYRSEEAAWAGLGALIAGLILESSAAADTRHLAELPRCVYIVPLNLGNDRRDVTIQFTGDALSSATWHDLAGGRPGRPAVYCLRMHDGNYAGMPRWSPTLLYSAEGAPPRPDWRPYLLGGRDLSQPADAPLREIYRTEGIVFRPGPQGLVGDAALDPALYRHVTLNGRVLWTPSPGTHGFEYLTRMPHPPYQPRTTGLQQMYKMDDPTGDAP